MDTKRFRIETLPTELVPNTLHRRLYGSAIGLTLLTAGAVLYLYQYLPSQIPLYMTEPWGEARLVAKAMIWLLPAMALAINILDVAISQLIKKMPVLSQILAASALVSTMMFVIAVVGIMQAVI